MFLVLLLVFPLLAAAATFAFGERASSRAAFGFSVITLAMTVAAYFQLRQGLTLAYMHEWVAHPKITFSIAADGLSFLMMALTNFLVPIIILSTFDRQPSGSRSFYALILLMQFALNGVFLATDGFLFYIFWELALLPIYFIALLWGEGHDKDFRNTAIFKFFVYTIAGSLFMLVAFIYLYQQSGSFLIQDWYALSLSGKEQCLIALAIFFAFAIKIPIFPFHTWQANAYKEAPTAGTMLLAGIMLKMGLYGLLRWLLPVVPEGVQCWTPLFIALSVVGIIYGSVIAITQRDMKRLLAYSSFAHVGLIAAGIFALNIEAFQGAVVQMIAHGVNVVGAFFAAEIIWRRTETQIIDELGGIRSVAPKFATAFMIVMLASVALPVTNAFIGEFLLLYGVFQYNTILSLVAGLTIILGAVYMLRMYQRSMLGQVHPRTLAFDDLTISELTVFSILTLAIFICGIYPKPIMTLAQPALESILQNALP
ncbi:MAG: NADH-quinone oxidoreductase subunit M [Chitinophagales bacterium]